MPSSTWGKNGLLMSGSMTPIVYVLPRMPRAAAFGRYPSSAIAWRTFARIAGLAPYELFRTLETVVVDTLACWATSTMVTRRRGGDSIDGPPGLWETLTRV